MNTQNKVQSKENDKFTKWKIGNEYLPKLVIVEDTEDEYSLLEIGNPTTKNVAIAERICKAVNSYAILIDALENIAACEGMSVLSKSDAHGFTKIAKQALLKAQS